MILTKPAAATATNLRSAGVLLHVTSLPGPYGIGDLGPEARAWVDWLARAKQTWWQVLPVGPAGAGNSPYQAFSAFAGNPLLISPDDLVADGLLACADVETSGFAELRIDYPRVARFKDALLTCAWDRFRGTGGGSGALKASLQRFRRSQRAWLADYALFMSLKRSHGDVRWTDWPRGLVMRQPTAMRRARAQLAEEIGREEFVQFLFFRQWDALRRYARQRGVRLMGDVPIFVSDESADVWVNPHLFELDRNRRPAAVAGVPPDYFCKTGQRWGNPLYDWAAMKRSNYAWWAARMRATLALVDVARIDHFRGFEAYWRIPARAQTAVRGRWVTAPGADLFRTLRRRLGGLPFIAEDLGLITPSVDALREQFGFPGMRILQFAFGGSPHDRFLPHNYERNSVVYTGTHDNDTTVGWYASLTDDERARVRRYLPEADGDVAWSLVRMGMSSVADHAIAPLQDVLRLGGEARMNLPGTPEGNWAWRCGGGMLTDGLADELGQLTELYGRTPPARADKRRG